MSHEPHIESIWNQARGLKDGTPNPDASVSEGQPSAAGAASAPEGNPTLPAWLRDLIVVWRGRAEYHLRAAHRAQRAGDDMRMTAACEHTEAETWCTAANEAESALENAAPPQADAKANLARAAHSLAPEEQPTVLLVKPHQADAARKLAGWPDALPTPTPPAPTSDSAVVPTEGAQPEGPQG